MTANGKPFRLNHSEIIALALSRSAGVGESVDITRNAKGEWQLAVTARTAEGETLQEAADRAASVVEQLAAKYPYPVYEEIAT